MGLQQVDSFVAKTYEAARLLIKSRPDQIHTGGPVQWVLTSTGASTDMPNCSLITPWHLFFLDSTMCYQASTAQTNVY